MVAIVGARNASALGIKFATRLARDLGEAGLVVASGLARGIDHAAIAVALDTGTVAVVAGGIDVIYPPENAPLYGRISKQGAVIAELPHHTAPLARHFPRRNRLICRNSRAACIVVEAAERSGSLITATIPRTGPGSVRGPRFAARSAGKRQQPVDPRRRHAHRNRGGRARRPAPDPWTVVSGTNLAPITPHNAIDDDRAEGVLALVEEKLGPAPVEIDELVRQCGIPAAEISYRPARTGARRDGAAPPGQSDCLAVILCTPGLIYNLKYAYCAPYAIYLL